MDKAAIPFGVGMFCGLCWGDGNYWGVWYRSSSWGNRTSSDKW